MSDGENCTVSLKSVIVFGQMTSHLGGDYGIADAASVIASVCCVESIPENTAPNSYKQLCNDTNQAVVDAEAVEILTEVSFTYSSCE